MTNQVTEKVGTVEEILGYSTEVIQYRTGPIVGVLNITETKLAFREEKGNELETILFDTYIGDEVVGKRAKYSLEEGTFDVRPSDPSPGTGTKKRLEALNGDFSPYECLTVEDVSF